jgi:putative ABC transport system permease protein
MFLMRLSRALRLALHSLLCSRLRSLLTLAAVALAVAALTIIVATMEGAERKAQEIAAYFGPTAVNVVSGDLTGQKLGRNTLTLTWDDVRVLRTNVPSTIQAAPFLYSLGVTVSGGGRTHAADSFGGTEEEHGKTWSWPVALGRDFTPDDVRMARSVCFLGAITAEKLFDDRSPLGEVVYILGVPLKVVGVLMPLGIVSDGVEIDDRVVMPITTMLRRFDFSPDHVFQIRVTFDPDTPESRMPDHVETVRSVMRAQHGLNKDAADDFILFTAGDILDFISFLKGGAVLFLGLTVVAAVLISGFVLANLFALSVAERQEEIGLKKALGAGRADIRIQFLFEALLLCLGGALVGVLAGLLASTALERFGLLSIALSWFLFIAAFVGAIGIGLVFGVRPARRAADLPPVIALNGGG